MNKNLTMTFTGDALFVADFPNSYDNDLKEISDVIKGVDVRITNLETNISEFGDFGNAYSGGTWLNTEPEDFKYLIKNCFLLPVGIAPDFTRLIICAFVG